VAADRSGGPRVPAVEGWFTTDAEPTLLGSRCTTCGNVSFPPNSMFCPDPDCDGDTFDVQPLSRQGTIWSYTDARYRPPPPYIPRATEHEPFAIAAVHLETEQLVVLGQVVDGFSVDDLHVGQQVELVVDELYRDDDTTYLVWKWRPVSQGETS
jgi:uncharacterized OB-fold protein